MPAEPVAAEAGANEVRALDYLTGDAFTVSHAPGGWWATTPVPADLSRYYPPAYYGGARRFPAPIEWLQAWLYGRRAGWVTRAAGKPGRVLDVGCGPGHLLARFRALGWETLGTEVSEAAAEIARRRHGLEVRVGALRDLRLPADAFDTVVSWHTLEHMPEPGEVLDEIARVLRPDGLLLISVPDFGSSEAQAQPSAWFHLDVPRHLCHFTARDLRVLLRRRGFTIEEESCFAPEYDAFSLVQTWQNRMGIRPNLLYLTLKSAASNASLAQRAAVLALCVIQLPVALAVTTWRTLRGAGAVIVMLARKNN